MIDDVKKELEAALKRYREIANGPADAARAASEDVKRLQRELSSAIVTSGAGAMPCQGCGNVPHGIEHQVAERGRLEVEYEVGCLVCPPVTHPSDGTLRRRAARAQRPRVAVEMWNFGPDEWIVEGRA